MSDQIQVLLDLAKSQLDPDERAKTLKEISRLDKVEREKRSQDLIMVHNIDVEDYIVVWDKSGANLRYLIPAEHKDVGEGQGNKTVPRYIANKFLREIITKVITKLSKKDFETKAKKYNGNWLGGYEEQSAIRVNDLKLWEMYTPSVWLGVVSKYGEEIEDVPEQDTSVLDMKKGQDEILSKLNLSDKKYEANKDNFIKEVVDDKPKGRPVKFISNR